MSDSTHDRESRRMMQPTIERVKPSTVAFSAVLGLAVATLGLLAVPAGAAPGDVDWLFESRVELDLADPPLPPLDLFPVQLVLDDDTFEGTLGVAGAAGARQFLWFNRFAQPPGPGFDLEEVWVLFPPAQNTVTGDPIELVVYLDPDGDPSNGADLLATFPETVQATNGIDFSIYPLPVAVEIRDPGDVLIGVIPRYIQTGDPPTAPATIDQTASLGRSWVAIWNADPPSPAILPGDLLTSRVDDLVPSFPGNWMIRGFGTPPPVQEIPTLGGLGLAALALLLLSVGWALARRRSATR